LGCLLYELVTGEPPFQAASFHEITARHLTEEPVPPSARRRGVPTAWESVILWLLRKAPHQRPRSCAAVFDAFAPPLRVRPCA
jgi:serine/threonine protein kinase